MEHNKDKGTSVGFSKIKSDDHFTDFTEKDWDDLQDAYDEEKASEPNISLTEKQVWFIWVAIEARTAVLPLDENQLSPKTFKEDYGYTQKEINEELDNLKSKLNHL